LRHPTRLKGFTLIELLVVISIIAILLSLLLPTLKAAKRAERVVHCSSNLKQFALGLTIYAYENKNGQYPANPQALGYAGSCRCDAFSPDFIWGPGYDTYGVPKEPFIAAFLDLVCGGNPNILYCPVVDRGSPPGAPYEPGYSGIQYEGLRYSGSDQFTLGYFRYAAYASEGAINWTNSGNLDMAGPPMTPGHAQDAILGDVMIGVPLDLSYNFENNHSETWQDNYAGYLENNVAYGDGHVETHKHHPVQGGGWDGEYIYNHAGQMYMW